jgi:hypothetical protein
VRSDGWAKNVLPRYGFFLRGGNDDSQAYDKTSCMSTVSDLKVTVTYSVPN